ncbi:hypothetical protein QO182_14635, partial [Flavobacterium sp. Arc2]
NKSTDVSTDGTSDTKYPTVKSIKTYVDASSTSGSTALTAEISRAKTAEIANADAIVTETSNRTTADATLASNLASEVSTARAAESTNATAIATETTNRSTADLLKEDLANKSTDVSTDGTSDTKYPTVKSVKSYVDASSTSSSSALTAEISRAKTEETANANAITAETTRATNSENSISANLVTETNSRTTADATLTSNLATEVTNRTTADLLKEDLTNKSTDVSTDGTSNTKYPTVKSVKSYVDASSTSSSSALTAEISRAKTAEIANADAIATETSNRTTADATLASNLASEASTARAAESANTAAITTETTNRSTVDLLKEDLVNKSTDVSTDGTSDTKYPTVKSVKSYVEGKISTSETATQTALDLKVDKETGKGLSTEDYSTVDKTKLASITGTNTGDQDLSSFATNSNLDLKANIASPTFIGVPSAPTAVATTNTTQVATTEYVTDAVSTSGANFLPLTGGTLTGTLIGTYGDFSSNFRVSSLTLVGNTSSWDFGPNGNGIALVQGGCCRRLTIDTDGRFGIGANYTPLYQLDVEGEGRFTEKVIAESFKKDGGTSSQFLKAD